MAEKKTTAKATPAKKPAAKVEAPVATKADKGSAKGLRIFAVILWLLAVGFEVLAILILNGNIPAFQEFLGTVFTSITTPLIIAIVADLVLVVIGSQLWKAANHKDPVSEKNKVKFVLWNNMGVIAAIIAFLPLIILLLKDKNLDGKTKKIVTVIAAVAIVIAAVCSIDFNPVSLEDMQAEATKSSDFSGEVYWTRFGKSYHFNDECQTLQNTKSENFFAGTLEEAFEAGRTDPCDFCAGGAEAKLQDAA